MSESNTVTREECEVIINSHNWLEDPVRRLARAHLELLDKQPGSEQWWDQNSAQCGCCSVQIVTRGGTKPENNGLSREEGEEELLCGRCAGEEIHRLLDANAALESEKTDLQNQVYELQFKLTETSKEAATFQRMYDRCFKERDEARARWVLDPIHGEKALLESQLAEARKVLGVVRTFVEYAKYELEDKHAAFEQFPCKECADHCIETIDVARNAGALRAKPDAI